ncbi:phospholipase B domain containing lamina ancestor, partial [Haematobia irritans]
IHSLIECIRIHHNRICRWCNGFKTAGTVLKVVGASWQKTRIGTYILIGAGLLVIGAFFIGYIERPEYDGTYCATAFWTKQVGFQIEYWKQQNDLLNIPKGAARICYKDSIYENGWAQIEIETQRSFPDWVQAYGAGIIEGSLTWHQVYNQWLNTIKSSCERDEDAQNFCTWLRDLLTENYVKIKETALLRQDHEHYWHQIGLFFFQLEGLETGYRQGAKRARSDLEEEIPFSDFLLMNAAADIQDLKIYYENYVLSGNEKSILEGENHPESGAEFTTANKNFFLPSATMLTKIFPADDDAPSWQLLFGHSTAGSYASMLRIQKRYKFHYHFGPNQRTNTVPGVDITFTGYPGILASTDDFYIVKGRQVQSIVAGVAMKNENLDLWKSVDVNQAVPLSARVMAANRIAQNRRTWAKAMAKHPYTGSKQWVTVDLNKLAPLDKLYQALAEDEILDDKPVALDPNDEAFISELHNRHKGLIWITEQLPGRMHMKDVTERFLNDNTSAWLANGVPYFDELLEVSNVNVDIYPNYLLPADNEVITNLEAVDKFLRNRAFRGDLLGDEELLAYGNTDIKLFAYNARLGISDYHAFAGPVFMRLQHMQVRSIPEKSMPNPDGTINSSILDDRLSVTIDDAAELAEMEMITERRPVRNDMRAIAMRQTGAGPFKWSSVSDKISDIEHAGHPDEWNFSKVSPKWAW